MKILKKGIAFMLAVGLMVSAMTVFAGSSYEYVEKPGDYPLIDHDFSQNGVKVTGPNGETWYNGINPPSSGVKEGDVWEDWSDGMPARYDFKGGQWVSYKDGSIYYVSNGNSGSCSSSAFAEPATKSPEEIVAIQQRAEADAVQGAAYDEGFADVGDMYRAAEKGMSAGEYYNNAVVSTPGIENAITVGQGGNLVVDGKVTNMSATISKVTNRAYVDSVRIEQEGTVLNVVDVSYPAVEATINFYTPGVLGGMEIVALQYNAGTWVEVEVAEVRDDHIVLNMKGNGVVAFIAK